LVVASLRLRCTKKRVWKAKKSGNLQEIGAECRALGAESEQVNVGNGAGRRWKIPAEDRAGYESLRFNSHFALHVRMNVRMKADTGEQMRIKARRIESRGAGHD
jgi:hypothetical protein